jgi:hypothetical protein
MTWLVTIILLGFLFLPIFAYLRTGWVQRRDEICDYFTADAYSRYFQTFLPAEAANKKKEKEAFLNRYHTRYGRRHFAFPCIFLLLIAGAALTPLSGTALLWLGKDTTPWVVLPPIAASAIAGAYMWVAFDLIARNRRSELHPVNVSRAGFRLLIAVPMGFAFAAVAKDPVGISLAFFAGAFPTDSLFTITRRLGLRHLKLSDTGNEKTERQLECLQCVTTAVGERYTDLGIVTVAQLAYCDPIDVAVRSSFSFNFVADCVSEALAWIYFEDNLKQARPYSLRGAQEIKFLMQQLQEGDKDEQKASDHVIQMLAKQWKMDAQALRYTLGQIADDPYTMFLWDVWAVQDET